MQFAFVISRSHGHRKYVLVLHTPRHSEELPVVFKFFKTISLDRSTKIRAFQYGIL